MLVGQRHAQHMPTGTVLHTAVGPTAHDSHSSVVTHVTVMTTNTAADTAAVTEDAAPSSVRPCVGTFVRLQC